MHGGAGGQGGVLGDALVYVDARVVALAPGCWQLVIRSAVCRLFRRLGRLRGLTEPLVEGRGGGGGEQAGDEGSGELHFGEILY